MPHLGDVAGDEGTNAPTGTITVQNPDTPPAQTYLDQVNVLAHLQAAERNPASSDAAYRRATVGILRWLFKDEDGYDAAQWEDRGSSTPDHVVLKIQSRPGGSPHAYDFMMVASKKAGESWAATIEECARHCENTHNESGQVYGMVQVGMDVQFYHWKNTTLTPLSDILNLLSDARGVMEWAGYLKAHPFPFVPFCPPPQ